MAEVILKNTYKVEFWEYERDWGSKLDEVKYYDNYEEAKSVVDKFNGINNSPTVPDWYMTANGPYKV